MSGFVELTDFEGNKFITQKERIDIVFSDDEEEGDAVIAVINGNATKIEETYDEVRKVLL